MSETMKKAIITGPRKAGLAEVQRPRAVGDWALVKVMAAPMCAEYKQFLSGDPATHLGHEAAGIVVDPGTSTLVAEGDRVVVMPQYPCGCCRHCANGEYIYCEHTVDVSAHTGLNEGQATMAQYLVKPGSLLMPIPDDVDFDEASLACCGLGPSHGAMTAMGVDVFQAVLVTGLGPVGIGAVINAIFRGARVIAADTLPWRLALARELGAETVDASAPDVVLQLRAMTGGEGPDCAVECSGATSAHRLCIDAVRRRGQVAFVGENYGTTPVSISPDFIRKGLRVMGSWHYSRQEYASVMSVIRHSPLIPRLISHRFPMNRIQEAFEVSASPEHAKIILHPWEE